MAGELFVKAAPGLSIYAIAAVRNYVGFFNPSSGVVDGSGPFKTNYANYALIMTDSSTFGYYHGSFRNSGPAPDNEYIITYFQRLGSTPAPTDTVLATETITVYNSQRWTDTIVGYNTSVLLNNTTAVASAIAALTLATFEVSPSGTGNALIESIYSMPSTDGYITNDYDGLVGKTICLTEIGYYGIITGHQPGNVGSIVELLLDPPISDDNGNFDDSFAYVLNDLAVNSIVNKKLGDWQPDADPTNNVLSAFRSIFDSDDYGTPPILDPDGDFVPGSQLGYLAESANTITPFISALSYAMDAHTCVSIHAVDTTHITFQLPVQISSLNAEAFNNKILIIPVFGKTYKVASGISSGNQIYSGVVLDPSTPLTASEMAYVNAPGAAMVLMSDLSKNTAVDQDVQTALTALATLVGRADPGTALTAIQTATAAIKAKTDNLPALPAARGDVQVTVTVPSP